MNIHEYTNVKEICGECKSPATVLVQVAGKEFSLCNKCLLILGREAHDYCKETPANMNR